MAQRPVTINSASVDKDSTRSFGRAIARASDGSLHVVFIKTTGGIFYAESTDGGATWTDGEGGGSGSAHQVSSSSGTDQVHPSIAIDDNDNIHVVWEDQSAAPVRINYRSKVSDVWQTEDTTSLASGTKNLREPQIIAHLTPDLAIHLHVVGPNTTDNTVFWGHSSDGGSTWSLNTGAVTSPTSQSGTKWGFDSDSGGHLHLVYVKNDGGTYSNRKGVYVKATFSSPNWTWGSTSESPWGSTAGRADDAFGLLVDTSDDIYVVYSKENLAGSNRLGKWTRSTSGGTSWAANATLSGTESYIAFPSLGLDSRNYLHLVYEISDTFSPTGSSVFRCSYWAFDKTHDKWGESNNTTGFRAWEPNPTLSGGNSVKLRYPHLIRATDPADSKTISAIFGNTGTNAVRFTAFSTRKEAMAEVSTGINNWKNTGGWGSGIVKTTDNKLHAVFVANSQIKYSRSDDDGVHWKDGEGGADDSTFNLDSSGTSGSFTDPAVVIGATSGGDIHTVWEDGLASPITLKYRRRVSGVWQSIDSTSLPVTGKTIKSPVLVIGSDNSIHIFAKNITDGDIYWAYSTNNGSTWTVNASLFINASSSVQKIGADRDKDNHLHICWINGSTKVSYAKATYLGGGSWSWGAEDSSSLDDTNTSADPDLIVDRRNTLVYVAFHNATTNHLRYAINTAGTWGAIANLTSDTGDSSDRAAVNLSADGRGNIYAFWEDLFQISGSNFRGVSHSRFDVDTTTWSSEGPIFDFDTGVSTPQSILGIEEHPADDDTLLRIMGDAVGTIGWIDFLDTEPNPTKTSTISGNGHIKAVLDSDISGNAFLNRADTISGNSHILSVISSTVSGNAHLKATLDETIDGNAHIRLGGETQISANAHIKKDGLSNNISGNAVIKLVLTDTISGNANLKNTVDSTIGANAVVVKTNSGTMKANAIIVSGEIELKLFIG